YSYGPSKAAIHHLTRTLASHLADRFITANAIAPGPFPSKMTAGIKKAFGDEITRQVPLQRWGEPADMAGVAIYLASRAGAYVSGAVIPVDGGIVASARTL
ncbi:MAG: SDR family oxidoreductase, partial [Gammaproteobacteria bacterium]|nr:SDR family oxidoreductase [Gammaproteobacteria bacterium]